MSYLPSSPNLSTLAGVLTKYPRRGVLLMVYAPARKDRYGSEEFKYLTQQATEAGFIVAYADHRNMIPETIVELAETPGLIEKKWCIDQKRIFLTGHSDGGTIAMGIAFINGTKHIPAAIAPSAVGIRGDDLQERNCPAASRYGHAQ